MLSHLLIDFDGTLVRQDPLLKLRFLWQAIRILDGTCSPYKVLAAAAAIRRALRNADGQSSIDATSAEVFERETGLSGRGYAEMCRIAVLKATRYEALDGALSFLQWAQRYFKLILATNPLFQRGVLVERLQAAGFDPDIFQEITCSEQFRYIKPQLGYYQEVMQRYDLDPKRCMMVGNDKAKDGPALQCGMDLFLLGTKPAQDFQTLRMRLEELL